MHLTKEQRLIFKQRHFNDKKISGDDVSVKFKSYDRLVNHASGLPEKENSGITFFLNKNVKKISKRFRRNITRTEISYNPKLGKTTPFG